MKTMTRREALWSLGASCAALLPATSVGTAEDAPTRRTGMGLVTYALGIHQRNQWAGRHQGLTPARGGGGGGRGDAGPPGSPPCSLG